MEMPENKPNAESKQLLGNILARTFEVDESSSFEDLLSMLDGVKACRETVLEEADQRICRLLNSTANTQLQ
jgi:hypothetical protein